MLSVHDAKKLVHAFVTPRLDYCNALLSGCANASLKPLQLVQNAAAHILTRTKRFEHITPVLVSLHWLPIKFRIDFKVRLITFKALNGLAPPYLKDLLHPYIPARTLRSQNAGLLIVPRVGKCTLGGRAFSYRAPLLWNNLPSDIRGADSLSIFKSRLKSYLYSKSFSWGTRLGFGIDHRVSCGLSDHCCHWLLRITLMSVPVPCLMSLSYAAIVLVSWGFPLFAHRHLFTPLFLLFCSLLNCTLPPLIIVFFCSPPLCSGLRPGAVVPEPVLTPLSANLLLLPTLCEELDLPDNSWCL